MGHFVDEILLDKTKCKVLNELTTTFYLYIPPNTIMEFQVNKVFFFSLVQFSFVFFCLMSSRHSRSKKKMADYILCGNITVKCGLKGKKEKNRMENLRMMVMMMTFMIFYTFQTNIIKKKQNLLELHWY